MSSHDPAEQPAVPFDIDQVEYLDEEPEAPERRPPGRGRQLLRGRSQPVDAQELLERVAHLIHAARPVPLSASAMINKEEITDLLDEALERLPDEMREARWLRKERDEYLAKQHADGEEILEAARAQAEHMVQRSELVKAAEHRARRIVDGAEAEARRLRLESEDFCDQKLAGFEIVLERTQKLVSQGRQKLQATNTRNEQDELPDAVADQYFDQPRHG